MRRINCSMLDVGDVGANFFSQTQFTTINNKKDITKNQCEKKNMFHVKRVALYKLGDCKQNITSLSLLVGTTVLYALINMAEVLRLVHKICFTMGRFSVFSFVYI